MAYALGPVKTHVRAAAEEIGRAYAVKTIYGVASREGASDHPLGLALDFMVYGDSAKGTAIANYVQGNARRLGVSYVIWQQRIWNQSRSSEGWRMMEDRGSITANHFDHVHVSFLTSPNSGSVSQPNPVDPAVNIPNPLGPPVAAVTGFTSVAKWLLDSENWLRLGFLVGGAALIIFAVLNMSDIDVGKVVS